MCPAVTTGVRTGRLKHLLTVYTIFVKIKVIMLMRQMLFFIPSVTVDEDA